MFSSSSAVRGEVEEAQMGRQSAGAARMQVFQCLQEAVLALRGKDTAAVAAAVEQLQAAAGCTAEHLLKLCGACQQTDTRWAVGRSLGPDSSKLARRYTVVPHVSWSHACPAMHTQSAWLLFMFTKGHPKLSAMLLDVFTLTSPTILRPDSGTDLLVN
jgi:hypothetical protein